MNFPKNAKKLSDIKALLRFKPNNRARFLLQLQNFFEKVCCIFKYFTIFAPCIITENQWQYLLINRK